MPNVTQRRRPKRVLLLALMTFGLLIPSAPAAGLAMRYPAIERYYKTLLDCTRRGGWVEERGACNMKDPGNRVPKRSILRRHIKLSDALARPYARRLARVGYLSHDLGGGIDARFNRIHMGGGIHGESLGFASGDPKAAVLIIHRLFQDEWSYKGWHFRNMTDTRFHWVGIGVWVLNGRTWLVLDFHS